MNFTIRGHDLTQVSSVEDLAEKTQLQGIHSLQLALGMSFPDMPSEAANINPGMGAYIKNVLARHEVNVGILSCYINMIHPNLEKREQLLQKFEGYLRQAKYFGASMVASETGCVYPEIRFTEENFTDKAFSDLVSVLSRLVKSGEKANMLLGIEPGLNHPLCSLERVQQLLTLIDSDYLGIILDPTNLITSDTYKDQVSIVEEAFELFGEKIVALHLKDYQVADNQIIPVNLGEGVIDYQGILNIVSSYRPMSYVVLEETKDAHIKDALKLLKEWR